MGMWVDDANAVAETNEANNRNQGILIDSWPLSVEADLPRPADGVNVRARPIVPDASVTSAIGDEWVAQYDEDIYSFTGTAGHTYDVSLTAPAGITARVYNGSWAPLAASPSGYTVPADGTYYVVVSSATNSTTNPRRLDNRT